MFRPLTQCQIWIFSYRDFTTLHALSNAGRPERQTRGCYKDGNETNFDIDRHIGSSGLCGDLGNPGKTRKKGLHINCSGLSSSWDKCYASAANACAPKGYKVIAKSGDAVEEPGDYPFGLNPAGYTSRSMIVICK